MIALMYVLFVLASFVDDWVVEVRLVYIVAYERIKEVFGNVC
jgi:hypothetical protein